MIAAARIVALLVAVPTFALLIADDRFTLDHLFFVPDLILCAALAFAAFTPRRLARRALILAFAFAAGVITTAVSSYMARDALEEGMLTVFAAASCVVLCIALTCTPARDVEREAT